MPAAAGELWDYMIERLRAYFLDSGSAGGVAGVTTEMFDAVRASAPVSPLGFRARDSRRCAKFLALPEAASLTAANKRISNILKKADAGTAAPSTCRCCASPPRRRCTRRWRASSPTSIARSASATTRAALARLATLRPAVDGFFDGVMVNAEDAGTAPQPPGVAGAAAPAVHAHRRPVLPARLSVR